MTNREDGEPHRSTKPAPAPPTAPAGPAEDDEAALRSFLEGRDAECPLCGYNLRGLTAPVCPECRQELVLSVGIRDLRLGWLLLTVAPSIFSGIAAVLLAIPIVGVPLSGGAPAPVYIVVTDAFGLFSGACGVLIAVNRLAFLRQSRTAQQAWAAGTWAVHLAAFGLLLAAIFLL